MDKRISPLKLDNREVEDIKLRYVVKGKFSEKDDLLLFHSGLNKLSHRAHGGSIIRLTSMEAQAVVDAAISAVAGGYLGIAHRMPSGVSYRPMSYLLYEEIRDIVLKFVVRDARERFDDYEGRKQNDPPRREYRQRHIQFIDIALQFGIGIGTVAQIAVELDGYIWELVTFHMNNGEPDDRDELRVLPKIVENISFVDEILRGVYNG